MQMTNIRNETKDTTTDPVDMKKKKKKQRELLGGTLHTQIEPPVKRANFSKSTNYQNASSMNWIIE